MKISLLTFCFILCISMSAFGQLKEVDFTKADSVASLYEGHSLTPLFDLTLKLTASLNTEQEKFRSIYRWVCNNIDNDPGLFQRNKSKRAKLTDPDKLKAWNNSFSQEVFRILIEKRRTVCTGYAYLIKEMATLAGLSCEIIDGYGRTIESNIGGEGIANHSWNAIRLNNKWFLCDATWSSGAIETGDGNFVRKFDEAYFLTHPETFIWKHYPLDTTWMLLDRRPNLRQFLDGPIVYSGALLHGLESLQPSTLNATSKRGLKFTFKLRKHSGEEIEQVELLIKGSRALPKKIPTYINEEGLLCFDYIFPVKQKYTVHILVKGDYAFTYNVYVK